MNIIITGGASGLGESITKALVLNKEFNIIITYKNSEIQAKDLEKKYPNIKAFFCDFCNSNSVRDFSDQIPQMNPDILINNAIAWFDTNHFHKINNHTFVNSFQYNVLPILNITQSCLKIFRKKKFGKIITILSSALIGNPPVGYSEYIANKAYLGSMSKSWAVENARFNITSNCISPSLLKTKLTQNIDSRIVESLESSHPLKRFLEVKDVAETVRFLISSTQHINGINLIINSAVNVI